VQTFIIASLTFSLLINPLLNKLSTNSVFVAPEHRQAISLSLDVPPRERSIVRRRFSFAVGGAFSVIRVCLKSVASEPGCEELFVEMPQHGEIGLLLLLSGDRCS